MGWQHRQRQIVQQRYYRERVPFCQPRFAGVHRHVGQVYTAVRQFKLRERTAAAAAGHERRRFDRKQLALHHDGAQQQQNLVPGIFFLSCTAVVTAFFRLKLFVFNGFPFFFSRFFFLGYCHYSRQRSKTNEAMYVNVFFLANRKVRTAAVVLEKAVRTHKRGTMNFGGGRARSAEKEAF